MAAADTAAADTAAARAVAVIAAADTAAAEVVAWSTEMSPRVGPKVRIEVRTKVSRIRRAILIQMMGRVLIPKASRGVWLF